MADIVTEIKKTIEARRFDLNTAEGRADLLAAIRTELDKVSDKLLRNQAALMLRDWRLELEVEAEKGKGKGKGKK